MNRRGHTRKAIRFPLEAPIMFWWTDSGVEKRIEGRTRDISETGAFVLASACPPPGAQIGFRLLLPVLEGFEPQTRVEAAGKVLRVEQATAGGNSNGFAISTQRTVVRVSNSDVDDLKANGARGQN